LLPGSLKRVLEQALEAFTQLIPEWDGLRIRIEVE
jgi:hypothetical protein